MKTIIVSVACALHITLLPAQRIIIPANKQNIDPQAFFSGKSKDFIAFSPGDNFKKFLESSPIVRKVPKYSYVFKELADSLTSRGVMNLFAVDTATDRGILSSEQLLWTLCWLSGNSSRIHDGRFYVFFMKYQADYRHVFIRQYANTWYIGMGNIHTPWVWPPGTLIVIF